MSTRKIIDAKHNGKKVWLKGHAQAIYMSDGSTVEDAINSIEIPSLNDYATKEWVNNNNYATEDDLNNIEYSSIKNIPISEDETGELNITDKNGNISMKVSSEAIYAKDFIADGHKLSEKINKDYVDNSIAELVDGAPETLNTLNEISAALKNNADIVDVLNQSIGNKQDAIIDLETIRQGAIKGATAIQLGDLSKVATSGSYNDLTNKPTIPNAVDESTVSDWGFTKNTGTYIKPSTGIPKSDLDSSVQTSLGKADTALQSYTELYKGTVTGIKINGTTKNPMNGIVDLGNIDTESLLKTYTFYYEGYHLKYTITQEEFEKIQNADIVYFSDGTTNIQLTLKEESSYIYFLGYNLNNYPYSIRLVYVTINELKVIISLDDISISDYISDLINERELSYMVAACAEIVDGAYIEIVENPNAIETQKPLILRLTDSNLENMCFLVGPYITITPETLLYKFIGEYNDLTIECVLDTGSGFLLGTLHIKPKSEGVGGSSSGNGAYAEVNHGTSDTTFTLTPNTFHIWDEVSSLTLTIGSGTSGIANEYLFQFTSGSEPTTLILPDTIKFNSDFTIEENNIYQISILNGLGTIMSWEFTPNVVLITFYYSGSPYSAEKGMTWEQWCNSTYNSTTLKISGGSLTINGNYPVCNSSGLEVYGTDVIIENENYDMMQDGGGA